MAPKEIWPKWFGYKHLPPRLQSVSKPFGELAEKLLSDYPYNFELDAALRKLLEAKDCAVRAVLLLPAEDKK